MQTLPLALLVAVLSLMTMCYATARYDVGPTGSLVGAVLVALLVLTLRRPALALDPAMLGGLLVAGALAQAIPGWSYLDSGPRTAVMMVTTATAAVSGLLLMRLGRAAAPALSLAGLGVAIATGAVAIALSTPDIDVLEFVTDASRHVFTDNIFTRPWTSSGIDDGAVHVGFPYLPMTAVILSPFGLLLDEPRWGLLLALAVCWLTIFTRRGNGPALALLLVLLPGTLLMIQSSWTEPLVAALLLPALVLLPRAGWQGWAGVLLLAAAAATKQHVLLLMPLLLLWPAVGRRKALGVVVSGLVLMAPWLLTDARAVYEATVVDLAEGPKRPDSVSVWILLDRADVAPPYGLMSLVVVATAGLVAMAARRKRWGVDKVALGCALVLLVGNLSNKQAFYNQFWLVSALILLGLACVREPETEDAGAETEEAGAESEVTGAGAAGVGDGRRAHAPAAP